MMLVTKQEFRLEAAGDRWVSLLIIQILRSASETLSDQYSIFCLFLLLQFDNLKQVFKTVEEMLGSLVDNIKTHFLLSDHLAK